MSLRPIIQSVAEQLAMERRCFVTAPWWRKRKARDELLLATAYGVQNCLRSLSMQFPAQGIEAQRATTVEQGVVHESPVAESDAPDTGVSGLSHTGGDRG